MILLITIKKPSMCGQLKQVLEKSELHSILVFSWHIKKIILNFLENKCELSKR